MNSSASAVSSSLIGPVSSIVARLMMTLDLIVSFPP
jgi:hypothetical protein